MTQLERIQGFLPGPYAPASDALLTQLLDVLALELETAQEDLDRLRQTHFIRLAYRLLDAEKLGALVGITRLPWEGLALFRERLLSLVVARLQGSLGPLEIRQFAYDYLRKAEDVLGCVLIPGVSHVTADEAYSERAPTSMPLFRRLELRENPSKLRFSANLAARSGNLPYLHRWTETNRGLDHSLATFRITGLFGGRTSVPLLVNRTSGDLIGYAGKLGFGQSLSLSAAVSGERHATATLDGVDASDHLFSVHNFVLGVPFARADLDATPQLPRMLRGDNDWVFLSVGLYDIRGLNQFFFSIADEQLREASFDDTRFNHALFPSGNLARLEMAWVETEPASFELRVPRYIVSEPSELVSELAARPMQQVASALVDSIQQLRAAGVRSSVTFVPFSETQPQSITVRLPWKTLDPETAPVGTADLLLGGRFGESSLGGARYE